MKRITFLGLLALFLLATPSYATTFTVNAGGNLQTAIYSAQPGDTIILQAGASFTGPFLLPAKGGSRYITIQSSALGLLPAPGHRVSPSNAANMPKIVAPHADNALRTAASASYYQFIGIEFLPVNSSATIYDMILLGNGSSAQNTISSVPHHLKFDRCYIHGTSTGYAKRGIALNSAETAIINSYITDFHVVGQDAQGIAGWNGPGPFQIVNNFIAASGQNIVFGGALPGINGLVPSDIEILRNHLFKPLSWKPGEATYTNIAWTIKSLLELKSGQRVLIEGNLMENNWGDTGYGAINFTVRNDSGSWATIQNVDFRNNIVRHVSLGFNILGLDTYGPTVQGHDVRIYNNVFSDMNTSRWTDSGWWMRLSDMDNLTIDHNVILNSSSIIWVYGPVCNGFVMTNNITSHNNYGIMGQDRGPGADTINVFFPSSVIRRNIITGQTSGGGSLSGYPFYYPTDNFYPSTLDAVGFVDRAGGDYNLTDASIYNGQATDGKDVGINQSAIESATAVLLTQP